MTKLKKILITPSSTVYKKIETEAKKQKRSVTNYMDAVISNLYKEVNIVDINSIADTINVDDDLFPDA